MHVYTVPHSAPFLHTTIAALVDGRLVDGFEARGNPQALAQATLYLPTRRAARLARDVFLEVLGGDAAILPRLVALGEIDEDELIFAQAAANAPAATLEILPALAGLERRLTLARLVVTWASTISRADPATTPLIVSGPAAALALADELARLMDDMQTRNVPWETLDTLVPDEHDVYWQHTLRFLKIAREAWPAILREAGKIEPSARRDLLIAAETERLASHRAGPVIAAGSTGSMPATAALLQTIAGLPNGAVVLPGLDTDLDDDAWEMIGGLKDTAGRWTISPAQSHPQFALAALLRRIGLSRSDVRALAEPASHGREILMSEAMRPSDSTAQWQQRLLAADIAARIDRGMEQVAVIAAANSGVEALAIAVAMREARHNNLTAALVTPNRGLARRVLAALERWNLVCNDSGGDPLTETTAGRFAGLIAAAVAEQLAPGGLLALLKHPLLRLGRKQDALRKTIADLELVLLRGTRPAPGIEGLRSGLDNFSAELAKLRAKQPSLLHRSEPRTRIPDYRLAAVRALIDDLDQALAPLNGLDRKRPHDFAELARCHSEVVARLSCDEDGAALALANDAGRALADAFDETLADGAQRQLAVRLTDYPDVFQTAFAGRMVRRPDQPFASLHIYGQLEARLTQHDRVILGGLTEGVWPPDPRNDPWLSRPMRRDIGLDLPERRIGLSAHDFVQLMGSPEIILSYAGKVSGAPAVASRFLHRLEAVAGETRWKAARDRGEVYLRYADDLDRPTETPKPIEQPAPRPPVSVRPTALSVTEIEDWLRDPYTIYAKHVLNLIPLDRVDMPLSAANRGSAIHSALGEFVQRFPDRLPDDAARILREFGEMSFAPLMDRPEARALWWPRFLRIATWFADWERTRREGLTRTFAETRGSISIAVGDRTFKLSTRADRIEARRDGRFAILDYKTGAPPSGKQVRLGLSPQLTLTAAILRDGGFAGIPAGSSVADLTYVRVSGNNPPGLEKPVDLARKKNETPIDPDQAADDARNKLEQFVRQFEQQDQPYHSLVLPMWKTRYGPYDDLARIKEWAAAGGRSEE